MSNVPFARRFNPLETRRLSAFLREPRTVLFVPSPSRLFELPLPRINLRSWMQWVCNSVLGFPQFRPILIPENCDIDTKRKNCSKELLNPPLPTFVDCFAGSGLVTQGAKHACTPVWSNDICPKKAAIYTANPATGS